MNSNNMTSLLTMVLGIMIFILLLLFCIWLYLKFKNKKNKSNSVNNNDSLSRKSKIEESYNVQSIFDFMEFEKIEDNMIIQKNGKRFLMVVKCQGINYDLMSGMEKNAVEQGFTQYLNTLRYPIQIYVQTRTVDLTGSISSYKEKVRKIGDNLSEKEFEYNQKVRSGNYKNIDLDKEKFEITKLKNLYEYGNDIVSNTERMSLNKNILSKQYFVILSYYPEEATDGKYSKDEVRNIAFSELYTRAQSTISLLSVSGINGKILDSMEIADLLYTAYNRDEAEMYDLKKAINSGYDNMYVTAPDILDKRMKELDRQIEMDAVSKANDAILKVKNEQEKEKMIRQKEIEYKDNVRKIAMEIIQDNEDILGLDLTKRAINEIENEEEKTNEQKKAKRVGRPRKTA